MSLVVEDGTGKSDAESYASVTDADTYHANRGNTAWSDLATADKEAALRKATDYMGERFAASWKGYRASTTQALDWPRIMVPMPGTYGEVYYASTDIPAAIGNACCELALRAGSGVLTPDQGQTIKSVQAGSVNVTYADYSAATKTYPAVDSLLRPYVAGSNGVNLSKA